MYLIQIFLPLRDNRNRAISRLHFDRLATELTNRFGGLTTYARAPATGLWKKGGMNQRDQIVIYEVLAPRQQRSWWKALRTRLEKTFRQREILIRSFVVTRL